MISNKRSLSYLTCIIYISLHASLLASPTGPSSILQQLVMELKTHRDQLYNQEIPVVGLQVIHYQMELQQTTEQYSQCIKLLKEFDLPNTLKIIENYAQSVDQPFVQPYHYILARLYYEGSEEFRIERNRQKTKKHIQSSIDNPLTLLLLSEIIMNNKNGGIKSLRMAATILEYLYDTWDNKAKIDALAKELTEHMETNPREKDVPENKQVLYVLGNYYLPRVENGWIETRNTLRAEKYHQLAREYIEQAANFGSELAETRMVKYIINDNQQYDAFHRIEYLYIDELNRFTFDPQRKKWSEIERTTEIFFGPAIDQYIIDKIAATRKLIKGMHERALKRVEAKQNGLSRNNFLKNMIPKKIGKYKKIN